MRRVLFLSDRPLGTRCLNFLLKTECQICGVVSRGKKEINWWGQSSVQSDCEERGIPWYDLSSSLNEIAEECRPDLIISVLYPKIVAKDLVNRISCFNLHCAPLPEYQGFNSTLWAIMYEEVTFGATLHKMSEKPDEGDIIQKGLFRIPPHTTNVELYRMSHENGYRIFCMNVHGLLSGRYPSTHQVGLKRYYKRTNLPSREVFPHWEEKRISTYARAFYFPPFEPAYMMADRQKIRLIPASLYESREKFLGNDNVLQEENARVR